ncbi:hypothetical protein FQR65_LT11925 [Abscondita terminalis]|nr:hypothetical protein FQR65_LT11925 [Abscondita terminalis]
MTKGNKSARLHLFKLKNILNQVECNNAYVDDLGEEINAEQRIALENKLESIKEFKGDYELNYFELFELGGITDEILDVAQFLRRAWVSFSEAIAEENDPCESKNNNFTAEVYIKLFPKSRN